MAMDTTIVASVLCRSAASGEGQEDDAEALFNMMYLQVWLKIC